VLTLISSDVRRVSRELEKSPLEETKKKEPDSEKRLLDFRQPPSKTKQLGERGPGMCAEGVLGTKRGGGEECNTRPKGR